MLGLFVVPDPSTVIASSSSAVNTYSTELYALLPYLGIFLALVVFGLAVWGVKKLAGGGARAIKGSRKRGRGRRRI